MFMAVPNVRADFNVRDADNRVIVDNKKLWVGLVVSLVDMEDPTLRMQGQVAWVTEDLAGVEVF